MINSIIYSGLTLYMMGVLLRWLGPWIELEFHGPVLRAIPPLTDPFIRFVKGILPPLGPLDWSPLAAIVGLYIVRLIIVQQ